MSPFITLTLAVEYDDVEVTLNAIMVEAFFASASIAGVTEVRTTSGKGYNVRETYEVVKERVAAGLRWEA
ncbi:hypothetical protein CcrC1_gp077 [Caulobacter phage C1]|nr:hypothetical protein CcrC1_gp077 [Caulobacter phage C1]UTU08305.1 hypothetical protein CcrC2_gp077 [Caulobacter phage C2]UTU08826.1 hypothetical protein CcrJ4_gp075 [Caulobacter phage J4]UTU09379.1 hypothetical protein CcrBL47_gp093 [Caulobacter phage BL47]UTU09939.1 hypothetical protein CcrRB23_gp077 [Caulobacter phage RB23]WGN96964.1 hypothetical protein [Bertelyvirus sp.]